MLKKNRRQKILRNRKLSMDDVMYGDKILISNYTIECLHSQNLFLFRTMQWNVYIFTENQKTYFFFPSVNFITQKTTSALLSLTST